jgi:hypothetical protein
VNNNFRNDVALDMSSTIDLVFNCIGDISN